MRVDSCQPSRLCIEWNPRSSVFIRGSEDFHASSGFVTFFPVEADNGFSSASRRLTLQHRGHEGFGVGGELLWREVLFVRGDGH